MLSECSVNEILVLEALAWPVKSLSLVSISFFLFQIKKMYIFRVIF